jgi:hypothetical protein
MCPGLLALVAVSGFSGATLYINLVEQPARMAVGGRAMIREWVPSNRRGLVMLSILALASGLLALANRRSGDTCKLALYVFRDGAREHLARRSFRLGARYGTQIDVMPAEVETTSRSRRSRTSRKWNRRRRPVLCVPKT